MRPPCVVPNVAESSLRTIYSADADEIIAFKRFLALPHDEQGRVLCPPHWLRYAKGEISGREAIEADDA
jgi:hypothetical protein